MRITDTTATILSTYIEITRKAYGNGSSHYHINNTETGRTAVNRPPVEYVEHGDPYRI